jgi:hypothetical protein
VDRPPIRQAMNPPTSRWSGPTCRSRPQGTAKRGPLAKSATPWANALDRLGFGVRHRVRSRRAGHECPSSTRPAQRGLEMGEPAPKVRNRRPRPRRQARKAAGTGTACRSPFECLPRVWRPRPLKPAPRRVGGASRASRSPRSRAAAVLRTGDEQEREAHSQRRAVGNAAGGPMPGPGRWASAAPRMATTAPRRRRGTHHAPQHSSDSPAGRHAQRREHRRRPDSTYVWRTRICPSTATANAVSTARISSDTWLAVWRVRPRRRVGLRQRSDGPPGLLARNLQSRNSPSRPAVVEGLGIVPAPDGAGDPGVWRNVPDADGLRRD